MHPDFDTAVKLAIYDTIAQTTVVPTSHDIAQFLKVEEKEVEEAFVRLHSKRLLVPEPGDNTRIRMAPPFSGVETAFPVRVEGKRYYANCVWDALGIAAALHKDAVVDGSDAHTGEVIRLEVRAGKPVPHTAVSHFAVPAALWWHDIIYT